MRRLHDFYETAPWQVDALVDHLPELAGTVFCPCVGDQSLMKRLQERRPDLHFVTNDLDIACAADFHGDATDGLHWHKVFPHQLPDWVIENPPFNAALGILQWAYDYAQCGVVFMTRVSFTEPTQARGEWLSRHPYQKRITLERHSFTANGKTDSVTTDWLMWAKQRIAGPFGISAFGYRDGSQQRLPAGDMLIHVE